MYLVKLPYNREKNVAEPNIAVPMYCRNVLFREIYFAITVKVATSSMQSLTHEKKFTDRNFLPMRAGCEIQFGENFLRVKISTYIVHHSICFKHTIKSNYTINFACM